jgi:peptidoglycan/LPS O-acetylase OafA/YrhL
VAILGVMGLHAVSRLVPGGFYGVDIFFVLSAFLITTLILEELDGRDGGYGFRAFYWRRFFRLAPALLLWLAFVAAPTAVALHESDRIPFGTLASLLYFGNFALASGADIGTSYEHVWSLAIEEQFYLVWPFLLVFLIRRRGLRTQRYWLTGGVAASLGLAVVARSLVEGNYFLPTGHLTCLAVGCLAGHAFVRGGGATLERLVQHPAAAPACLAFLVLAMFVFQPRFGYTTLLVQPLLAGAAAVLLLSLALRRASPSARLLTAAPLLWIGRRSYGLYLYHRTLALLLPALIPGLTLRYAAPLVLALSLVVAEASFRFVERPVNIAGRAWLKRRHQETAVVPEYARPVASDAAAARRPTLSQRPREQL